jgi:DNA-binding FadR family transcriptional regulator
MGYIRQLSQVHDARLPPEDAISSAVGVSRGPVREAMKVLEALGAIEIRRGVGTYIVPGGFIALDFIMAMQKELERATARDLFELRLTVERAAAMYAAERCGPADLDRIAAANDDMRHNCETPDTDFDALTRADVAFHKAIYDAAGNPLLGTIGKFVTELVAPQIRAGHVRVGGMRSVINHEQIIASLRDRNPGAALEATDLSPVAAGLARWQEAISDPPREPEQKEAGS